jgi:hypothetical protein
MKRILGLWLLGAALAVQAQEGTLLEGDTLLKEGLVEPVGPPKPVVVVNEPSSSVPVTGIVQARDLDNPARQPFQAFMNTTSPSFTVPEGKRLVIEYVSGSISGSATCTVNFGLLRTALVVNGTEVAMAHFLPAAERLSPISMVIAQLTRFYADPGTEVRLRAETDPNNCDIGFSAQISGHLVDVP